MATSPSRDVDLDVRLSSDHRRLIEEAAAALGQTAGEFAAATVVREARKVLQETQATHLSRRDRDAFLAALEDVDAQPNAALIEAAERYAARRADNG